MFGLFIGAVALGLRGAGHAHHAYENYNRSKRTTYVERWRRSFWVDRNGNCRDASTGHRIREITIHILSDGSCFYPSAIAKGAREGDIILWDDDTRTMLVNVTANKHKVMREQTIREWDEKGYDHKKTMEYVDRWYPER